MWYGNSGDNSFKFGIKSETPNEGRRMVEGGLMSRVELEWCIFPLFSSISQTRQNIDYAR